MCFLVIDLAHQPYILCERYKKLFFTYIETCRCKIVEQARVFDIVMRNFTKNMQMLQQ